MRECACGAVVTEPGHVLCWACAHEPSAQLDLLTANAPPCPRCGSPLRSDADLALLATHAYAACFAPAVGTLIPDVIKDSLRKIVRIHECRLGACYVGAPR